MGIVGNGDGLEKTRGWCCQRKGDCTEEYGLTETSLAKETVCRRLSQPKRTRCHASSKPFKRLAISLQSRLASRRVSFAEESNRDRLAGNRSECQQVINVNSPDDLRSDISISTWRNGPVQRYRNRFKRKRDKNISIPQ